MPLIRRLAVRMFDTPSRTVSGAPAEKYCTHGYFHHAHALGWQFIRFTIYHLPGPVRRVFFCLYDWNTGFSVSFYKDVKTYPTEDPSHAQMLSKYFPHSDEKEFYSIYYFNGILYWTKNTYGSEGIVSMKDYERANRSYVIKEYEQFNNPVQILITCT